MAKRRRKKVNGKRETEVSLCLRLARNGFSYRLIATKVFGDKYAVGKVGQILYANDVRVRDYRDGRNREAKGLIAALLR